MRASEFSVCISFDEYATPIVVYASTPLACALRKKYPDLIIIKSLVVLLHTHTYIEDNATSWLKIMMMVLFM